MAPLPPSDADIISGSSQREAKGKTPFCHKATLGSFAIQTAERERESHTPEREAEQRRTSEEEGSRGRECSREEEGGFLCHAGRGEKCHHAQRRLCKIWRKEAVHKMDSLLPTLLSSNLGYLKVI